MTATNDANFELGHRLVLSVVLTHAEAVPWSARRAYMLAVANALFHCNCCDDGPDDAAVLAACQRALTVDAAA